MSALVAWVLICVFQTSFTLVLSDNLSNKDLVLEEKTATLEDVQTKSDLRLDRSTAVNSEKKHTDAILKLEGRLLALEKKVRDQEDTIAELNSYKSRFHILERTVRGLKTKIKQICDNHDVSKLESKVNNNDNIAETPLDLRNFGDQLNNIIAPKGRQINANRIVQENKIANSK